MNRISKSVSLRQKLLAAASQSAVRYAALLGAGFAGLVVAGAPHEAKALNLYDGQNYGNNIEINLETTLSYSGIYRINDPSAFLLNNPNGDDGDRNFQHGIVNNAFQVTPVLDIRDGDFGLHASGEAYLNTPYLDTNQNNSPGTVNPFTISKNTDFASATRNINGENARLLDAFAFGKYEISDNSSLSLKVGRQTLLWGQSLYFLTNGISNGQAPFDAVASAELINPQTQQTILPVGQAVLTYQNGNITVQGYYQFEFEQYNLQGVGSYFSSSDLLDKGGQRLILGGGTYFFRIKDNKPASQNGRFGLSVQATLGPWDVGLYGLRYDQMTPEFYTKFTGSNTMPAGPTGGISEGLYQLVYPRDIGIVGGSFSTSVGTANVAGEIADRINMPLVSNIPDGFAGNYSNGGSGAKYAVGNVITAQSSLIYVTPPLFFDPAGMDVSGEIAMNHVVKVTRNRDFLQPGNQSTAAAFDISLEPTYFDVLPNLQIGVPLSINYNFLGRSQVESNMYHGNAIFDAGITATYEVNWVVSLAYQDYLGKPQANALADRGYMSLGVTHTF